jgi:putative ABC transport system substrate-binding protein
MSDIRRREFITLLSGAAVTWPLAASAQQAGKLPTIGFLGADASAFSPWTAAFVAHLRELGWIENRNIAIEYRWSEGRTERYAEIAAEFVRLKVDVIVTVGSAVPTVVQVTTAIPIVFAVAIDPVGNGLVASLANPGGNVTGLSLQAAHLAGKRLELLREVVPQLRRLAIIFNVGNAQALSCRTASCPSPCCTVLRAGCTHLFRGPAYCPHGLAGDKQGDSKGRRCPRHDQ